MSRPMLMVPMISWNFGPPNRLPNTSSGSTIWSSFTRPGVEGPNSLLHRQCL